MSAEIVVADDSTTMLSLLVLALKRQGYEPATARDGAEAVERVREHRPKLLILDAMMPNGDGFDVCRAIQDDPELEMPYVIMVTAAGRLADRERAAGAGVDEFLTKPFSPSELGQRVRQILGRE
jgi:two-component system alkaline phosphatase synthesis response regulator PhoP